MQLTSVHLIAYKINTEKTNVKYNKVPIINYYYDFIHDFFTTIANLSGLLADTFWIVMLNIRQTHANTTERRSLTDYSSCSEFYSFQMQCNDHVSSRNTLLFASCTSGHLMQVINKSPILWLFTVKSTIQKAKTKVEIYCSHVLQKKI